VPPSPVPGAPTGKIVPTTFVVVVVAGTVVVVVPGTVVVVVGGTVVVVVGGTVVVVVGGTVVVVVGGTVVVVVGGGVAQMVPIVGRRIALSWSVTGPDCAMTRPTTLAPVSTITEVSARIVPEKIVEVPSVAVLPTCQKTLQAWALPARTTELFDAVIKVESD